MDEIASYLRPDAIIIFKLVSQLSFFLTLPLVCLSALGSDLRIDPVPLLLRSHNNQLSQAVVLDCPPPLNILFPYHSFISGSFPLSSPLLYQAVRKERREKVARVATCLQLIGERKLREASKHCSQCGLLNPPSVCLSHPLTKTNSFLPRPTSSLFFFLSLGSRFFFNFIFSFPFNSAAFLTRWMRNSSSKLVTRSAHPSHSLS